LQQNEKYFGEEDKVHLPERGKRAISSCFRDRVHQNILREYELLD
jgi:hypothetical protein